MKRTLAAAIAVLAVLSLLLVLPSGDPVDADDPLPQELYPDADAIISETAEGGIMVTTRNADTGEYSARTLSAGSAVSLSTIGSIDGSFSAVMTGGRVGDLTLVSVNTYIEGITPVDVSFEQVSGEIGHLRVAVASSSVVGRLPNNHYGAYSPIGDVSLVISGKVAEIVPTLSLLGVSSISIVLNEGCSVDRLYPTGEDGSYGSVSVTMYGGTVGYMSNQSAVATALSYRFIRGTVEYLCLGADVEGGSGYYRYNMWTFYVIEGADIEIEEGMEIGRAIMGCGIIDRPSILCNNQIVSYPVTRSVTVAAQGTVLLLDRAFSTHGDPEDASDGTVHRFQNYTIGSTPSSSNQRSTLYSGSQVLDVYGESGIWASAMGCEVADDTIVYLEAEAAIRADAAFGVPDEAVLVNSGTISVYGTMEVVGAVRNGGIIEERGSGAYSGRDPSGSGFLAQAIVSSSVAEVRVMTVTRDTVALRSYSGEISFNSALAIIQRIGCSLQVSAPGDLYIRGDPVILSAKVIDPDDGYAGALGIYVSACDGDADHLLTLSVTVSLAVPEGYAAEVIGPSGDAMGVVASDTAGITFAALGNGVYQYRLVATDGTKESGDDGLSPMTKNIIVAAAIVVIAALLVYLLLRRYRGP